MDCDIAREALSARIDGEREPMPAARVDEHLAGCEPCRNWQAAAVEQTHLLRRLAGRSQLSAVRQPAAEESLRPNRPRFSWQRWALGAVGLVQLCLALTQGLGVVVGIPDPEAAEHVLNESTAWSAALGVAMLVAAIRPVMAGGLTWVLGAFAGLLMLYEVIDADEGRVTFDRPLTHLPVIVGAVLAVLMWRRNQSEGMHPDPTASVGADDIDVPDHAVRARRRGHLSATDGSAA